MTTDIISPFPWPGSPIVLVFQVQVLYGETSAGACWFRKKSQFSANILLYLENGARQAHGCYGTLIGSHRYPIDPCQFR